MFRGMDPDIPYIAVSRLTAFASYIFMAHTFLSKIHCTAHALSTTYYISSFIPFTRLHHIHKLSGKCSTGILFFFTHDWAHHSLEYTKRYGNAHKKSSRFEWSLCTYGHVSHHPCFMSSWAKHRMKWSFEIRFNLHFIWVWDYLFLLFAFTRHVVESLHVYSGM